MAYKNKEDQAAAARRHYEANKDKMKARARAFTAKVREDNRAFLKEVKSKPCTDCKKSYPSYVMDFDHLGEDKTDNIGTMIGRGVSRATLQKEIDKCELVCSNCHRERTHQRRMMQ